MPARDPVLPSAYLHSVGIPEYLLLAQQGMDFAAQFPASTFLCQRFHSQHLAGFNRRTEAQMTYTIEPIHSCVAEICKVRGGTI